MLPLIAFLLAVLVAAAIFALFEIQIEGSNGWASSLPTWRFQSRWLGWLLGSRVVTGYHFYAHLFILVLVHLPYVLLLIPLGLAAELRILAFVVLFWIAEDFLWFVLNPSYGVRRFTRKHVWWHARSWWWFMPREYWIFTPIGIALYVLSRVL